MVTKIENYSPVRGYRILHIYSTGDRTLRISRTSRNYFNI